MIRALVDFALNNRFVVLAAAVLLLAWGAISFHTLPVEAYPDIADNYATIITQWPGRSAEEVEQQVTIPVEIQMNGIPHLTHSAVRVDFWSLARNLHLRRPIRQRLEPPEGPGKAHAGQRPARRSASNRHRLEHRRPDLLVHDQEHQSSIRPDEHEEHRGLDP